MQLCNINSLAITHTQICWAGVTLPDTVNVAHLAAETLVSVSSLLVCSFLQHCFRHSFPPGSHDASPNVFLFNTEKHGGSTSLCVCVCVLGWYRKVVVLLHYVLRYHYIIALAWGGVGVGVQAAYM